MSVVGSSFDYFSTKAPVLRQPLGFAADTQRFGVPGAGLLDDVATAGGKRFAKNIGGDATTAALKKQITGELAEELGEELAETVGQRVGKQLAESGVTKATKKEVGEKIAKELIEDGVAPELAEKIAKEAVQKQVKSNAMNAAAERVYSAIRKERTQETVMDLMQTRDRLYEVLDYHRYEQQIDDLIRKSEK